MDFFILLLLLLFENHLLRLAETEKCSDIGACSHRAKTTAYSHQKLFSPMLNLSNLSIKEQLIIREWYFGLILYVQHFLKWHCLGFAWQNSGFKTTDTPCSLCFSLKKYSQTIYIKYNTIKILWLNRSPSAWFKNIDLASQETICNNNICLVF